MILINILIISIKHSNNNKFFKINNDRSFTTNFQEFIAVLDILKS